MITSQWMKTKKCCQAIIAFFITIFLRILIGVKLYQCNHSNREKSVEMLN